MSGTLYAVGDQAREVLRDRRTKSEWYEALGTLGLEHAQQLSTEDALEYGWQWALAKEPPPLGLMFSGDLRAQPDEFDDPDVVFLGRALTHDIAIALAAHDEAYFRARLRTDDGQDVSDQIWLLKPLRDFFQVAASRADAVIILWGY